MSPPSVSNVGFLELTDNLGHQELLTRYLRIATAGEDTPVLFTTPSGIEKIDDTIQRDSLDVVVGRFNYSFLKQIEQICAERLDVLFINTVEGTVRDLLRFARFDPECATILWPHNARAWFERRFVWDRNSGLSTTLSYNMKNLFRPYILSQMDGILLPFTQSAAHIRERYNPPQHIHTLPPAVYEDKSQLVPETSLDKSNGKVNTTRITIPGSINERRDYETVLTVFENKIFPKFGDNVELVLLGRPQGDYGDRILNYVKSLEDKGYSIQYFTEWIKNNTFSREFEMADIVLNPVAKDDAERDERWGLTWNSGVLFDILMYPTPLILPDKYAIPDELKTATMTYNGHDDLTETIISILSNSNRRESLNQNSVANARAFDRKSQFDRFLDIVAQYTD